VTLLPTLSNSQAARERVYRHAIRTPLLRLNASPEKGTEIYLKLENLQPIGSFKIRGAANAIEQMSEQELRGGVVTASMGNMAQGVASCAAKRGVRCTVIVPEMAAENKVRAIERLGGHVIRVTFDEWWRAFLNRSHPGVEGVFIHAFDDLRVMEGNGTIALEILEDLPDVDAVIVPWGGGGLASGIAGVLRAARPGCKIYAAEVATAAPLSKSLALGAPAQIEYKASFVDGIGAKSVFPDMFDRAKALIDGALVAEIDSVAAAVKLLAERNRVVAEGAGACAVACALDSSIPGKVVCIVSGGNIDTTVFANLLNPQVQ